MNTQSCRTYTLKLVRERAVKYARNAVNHQQDAAHIIRAYVGSKDVEHFVAVMLDSSNQVIGVHTVNVGQRGGCRVQPRDVFKAGIVANAAALVIGHNRPSGDPRPSDDDIATTTRLVELGKALGLPIVDHVIVTMDREHSMFTHGEGGL